MQSRAGGWWGAATLDEFYPRRVTLCLGVGAPADLKSIGIGVERPLRIMREALELARALLAGETVRVDGQFFHAHGRRLASGTRTTGCGSFRRSN